ncbi:hypothetical protein San01_28850 [Streptomyces angustmyceticus]|uniref:Uncharacterized protein n=1 Tax=Streptomyces angustmyceticus TaxID=285578 RepID=A0A5J4LIC0_9ACTN|nr:hypothetical protein San01_28850 [Streptomyces angustmyceticus]
MHTKACGVFSPDFLTSKKTMIASSTTAEIESATAAHLQVLTFRTELMVSGPLPRTRAPGMPRALYPVPTAPKGS